jgi:hypothetical protein
VSANHDRVKGAVLLDANNLVDVVKVLAQVLVGRIVAGPVPRLPNLGPGELILGNLGVDASSGVAVPSPSASGVVASLEDDCLEAAVPESFEHKDASYKY